VTSDVWLGKLTRLRVYKAKHGNAPHKPLLLLVVLELGEQGELTQEVLRLTPELAFRFNALWPIVAHRRTQEPDLRMPFHRLSSEGFWTPFTENNEPSPHQNLTRYVAIDTEFLQFVQDAEFRANARRILIAKWFNPPERHALYTLYRMRIPTDDEIARDAKFETPDDAKRTGREARFRLDVVPAYSYACALTGYRVTTIDRGSIVDAAHIHEFSSSRNNDPSNGIALCKNAHWMFDTGLWTLSDEYRVIVANGRFSEDSPDQRPLSDYDGERIRLPADRGLWPDPKHLAWHRKNRFLGA
jgi:putative restriction endonuclease